MVYACIPHICIFLSTNPFLAQFFSTQKGVNPDKTDYTTKQHKMQQNRANIRFVSICHVEKSEIPLHMEKFQISAYLWCDKGDKYEV